MVRREADLLASPCGGPVRLIAAGLLVLAAVGCAGGPRRGVEGVPDVRQAEAVDCGAAATAALLGYWGVPVPRAEVRAACETDAEGMAAGALRAFIRGRGLEAFVIRGTADDLAYELGEGRPVLAGLVRGGRSHFVLVTGVAPGGVRLLDPAEGVRHQAWASFEREWSAAANLLLVAFPGGNC